MVIAHIQKYILWYGVVVFALAGGGVAFGFFAQNGNSTVETVQVKRGTVINEARFSGRVTAIEDVQLGFETGGTVAYVRAAEGDAVAEGDLLAALEQSRIESLIAEASASIARERAELRELRRGAREEELAIAERKVAQARQSLDDARQELFLSLQSAFVTGDDAILNKSDQFFTSPRSSAPKIVISSYGKTYLQQERFELGDMLGAWGRSVQEMTVNDDLEAKYDEAAENLNRVKVFLTDLSSLVSRQTPSGSLTQTLIDAQNALMTMARTNVTSALDSLANDLESVNNANAAFLLAEDELALTEAGSSAEAIAAQSARLASAEAAFKRYEAEREQMIIRSPIQGVVAKRNIDPGETVGAFTPVFSIISDNPLREIEADVSELDIGNITKGDTAVAELDAYPNVFFEADVTAVDLAETIISGVPSYGVTLRFREADDRIRPGMTANVLVSAEERRNALFVPSRAVRFRDRETYVHVLRGELVEERIVETGLSGRGNVVEILSGLSEGEVIVLE